MGRLFHKLKFLTFFTILLPVFGGVFFSDTRLSAAQSTESNYQLLAPLPTIEKKSGITLVDYMKGLFVATIGLAIVLAVVELVIGGIEYVAAAVPSSKEDAKKRIGGAVGGLLLILVAWILLQALNPKLLNVGLNLEKVAVIEGVPGGGVPGGAGTEPTVTQWCGVGRLTGEWIGIPINTEKECNDVKGIMETCQLCSSLWCIDGPERGTVRYGSKEKCENNSSAGGCSLCTATTPATTGEPSGNEAANQKILTDAGIGIKPGVQVAGTRDSTLNEIVALKGDCASCSITVTSGTEGSHAEGTYSHANGYKIDLRLTDSLNGYIKSTYTLIGTRSDGAPLYQAPSGALYALESNHWDVLVK